jgi:tryptophanyl-tRNA synthetase
METQYSRILSGVKPTGNVHLGNYVGMIRPLVDLQRQGSECFLFIADFHALNQVQNPVELRDSVTKVTLAYIAAGFDTTAGVLYRQSDVPQVATLTTILNTMAPLGLLDRAHAIKDAHARGKEELLHMGTYDYPVLMTSDIVLYRASHVPVGQDQVQHLEIARDIVQKYNRIYSGSLVEPQQIVQESLSSIPGIDGQKMSKSYGNTLGLFDTPDEIRAKIAKVVTDGKQPSEPKSTDDVLMQILSSVSPQDVFIAQYAAGGIGYKDAKDYVADALITSLQPFRDTMDAYTRGEIDLSALFSAGATRAAEIADATLADVYQQTGLR